LVGVDEGGRIKFSARHLANSRWEECHCVTLQPPPGRVDRLIEGIGQVVEDDQETSYATAVAKLESVKPSRGI
jgi:hypothetical protein